jgi:hypothetical protein
MQCLTQSTFRVLWGAYMRIQSKASASNRANQFSVNSYPEFSEIAAQPELSEKSGEKTSLRRFGSGTSVC